MPFHYGLAEEKATVKEHAVSDELNRRIEKLNQLIAEFHRTGLVEDKEALVACLEESHEETSAKRYINDIRRFD